jgi:hypothetical protein
MRVIDGMHRLMAASLPGRETIDVTFFDGSEANVFLRAFQETVAHGLPLSRQIVVPRPTGSSHRIRTCPTGDRPGSGLGGEAMAANRKRSTGGAPQSNARVGRDGKIRPLDSAQRRRRAAEILTKQLDASLRGVARAAGISPATV